MMQSDKHPDAELLSLCTAWWELQGKIEADLTAHSSGLIDTKTQERLIGKALDASHLISFQISAITPQTVQGVHEQVRWLIQSGLDGGIDFLGAGAEERGLGQIEAALQKLAAA